MDTLLIDFSKIQNDRIREYFKEVVSSYNIGNYRSVLVMLYAVTVCDILYKLKDLSELYGDATADGILKEYEKKNDKKENSYSKSSWEFSLINAAYNAGLIDSVLYSEINTLYTYRNMSAHPILDQNYELYSPSKEIAVAFVLSIYNGLLSQPPLYISNVIDSMTEDLKKRKTFFLNDHELFVSSITDKYLSHMNEKYTIQVFKAFWKFCFVLENDDCNENRVINIAVLRLILQRSLDTIEKAMSADPVRFRCSVNYSCASHLVVFLSDYPSLYKHLRREDKRLILSFLNREKEYKAISWFLNDDLAAFLEELKRNEVCPSFDFLIKRMNDFFSHNGRKRDLLDFYIDCYSRSTSFEQAKGRWNKLISPHSDSFSVEQLKTLIKVSNENSQIFNSYHSYHANTVIVRELLKNGPLDFDLGEYPLFDFDKSILNETEEREN